MTKKESKIILFDGICNFCNSSVNFIMDNDKKDLFRFASLQSDYGQNCLKDFNLTLEESSTLILVCGDKHYTRSSAALRIAKDLSFPYNFSFVFIAVPPFIRNFFYDVIARNRYKWFGMKDTCRIPSANERSKFIE